MNSLRSAQRNHLGCALFCSLFLLLGCGQSMEDKGPAVFKDEAPIDKLVAPGFSRFPSAPPALEIFSGGDDDLWILMNENAVTHFDGKNWGLSQSLPSRPAMKSITGSSRNDVWLSCDQGTLLHWDGTAWTSATLPTSDALGAMWTPGANRLWVLGKNGALYAWDGTTARAEATGTTQQLSAVWGIPAGDGSVQLVAVGNQGTVILGTSGMPFATLPAPPTQRPLAKVWGTAANDIWVGASGNSTVMGDTAAIFHWNGDSWSTATLPYPSGYLVDITGFRGSGANDLWAGFSSINVNMGPFHWDGTSWSAVPIQLPYRKPRILLAGNATGELWMMMSRAEGGGSYGTYLYRGNAAGFRFLGQSTSLGAIGDSPDDVITLSSPFAEHWNGSTWSDLDWAGQPYNRSLVQRAANDVWLSDGGQAMHWNGSAWTSMYTHTTSSSLLLAGSASGEIWIWDSPKLGHWNGSSFVFASCPVGDGSILWNTLLVTGSNDVWIFGTNIGIANLPPEEEFVVLHWTSAGCTAAKGPDGIFLPKAGWAAAENDAWMAGENGRLSHFDGSTWTDVDTGLSFPATYFNVWGFASNDVWAATIFGQLMHWNGRSWSQQQLLDDSFVHIGHSASGYWAVTKNGQILSQ